jgi:transitional endoplasmic reticulum ATPase
MYKIEIPNPDPAQRTRLFQIFLGRQQRVDFNVDEIAAEMSQKAGNISGRDIDNLVRAASQTAMERAFAEGTPDQIVLTRKDLLAQLSTQLKEVSDEDLEKIWSQIVLKPDIKKSILSKIRMFNSGDKATPRGLLLYGPPGTGKTEIARRIADSTNSVFESLSIASLKAGYTGQSGQLVKQLWDKARSRGRAVIFVDECEGVFGRRGGLNTDSFSEEIIQEFLAQWDGVGSKGQIWVIGATNRRDMLDEAIVSRFGAAWEIGLPDVAERVQILRLEMRKMERDTEIPEFVGALTTGLAGRGLATVARDVCTMAAEQKTDIQPEMWREVLARYTKASSDAVDAGAHWDSLVLPDNTLRKLKTVCDSMKNAEILAKQGFEPLRGALLYGPPGTGKTQIARTLANESGVAFIGAGPADLKAGYLGQSVQKVNELFQRARDKAPSILFIDEIEACCADRNGPNADQYTNEIVTEFLRQMDGVKKVDRYTFVLAATNHPNLVDAAILSRFEEKIEIRNPGPAEREQLLKVFLRKYRVDFDVDAMAAELSSAVGDVGGRDIQSLVRRASQVAVQRALDEKRPDQVILTRQDLLTQIDRAMHA